MDQDEIILSSDTEDCNKSPPRLPRSIKSRIKDIIEDQYDSSSTDDRLSQRSGISRNRSRSSSKLASPASSSSFSLRYSLESSEEASSDESKISFPSSSSFSKYSKLKKNSPIKKFEKKAKPHRINEEDEEDEEDLIIINEVKPSPASRQRSRQPSPNRKIITPIIIEDSNSKNADDSLSAISISSKMAAQAVQSLPISFSLSSLNKSPVANNNESSRRASIRKNLDVEEDDEAWLPEKKRMKRSNSTRCVDDKIENSKAGNRGRRSLGAACAMPSFDRKSPRKKVIESSDSVSSVEQPNELEKPILTDSVCSKNYDELVARNSLVNKSPIIVEKTTQKKEFTDPKLKLNAKVLLVRLTQQEINSYTARKVTVKPKSRGKVIPNSIDENIFNCLCSDSESIESTSWTSDNLEISNKKKRLTSSSDENSLDSHKSSSKMSHSSKKLKISTSYGKNIDMADDNANLEYTRDENNNIVEFVTLSSNENTTSASIQSQSRSKESSKTGVKLPKSKVVKSNSKSNLSLNPESSETSSSLSLPSIKGLSNTEVVALSTRPSIAPVVKNENSTSDKTKTKKEETDKNLKKNPPNLLKKSHKPETKKKEATKNTKSSSSACIPNQNETSKIVSKKPTTSTASSSASNSSKMDNNKTNEEPKKLVLAKSSSKSNLEKIVSKPKPQTVTNGPSSDLKTKKLDKEPQTKVSNETFMPKKDTTSFRIPKINKTDLPDVSGAEKATEKEVKTQKELEKPKSSTNSSIPTTSSANNNNNIVKKSEVEQKKELNTSQPKTAPSTSSTLTNSTVSSRAKKKSPSKKNNRKSNSSANRPTENASQSQAIALINNMKYVNFPRPNLQNRVISKQILTISHLLEMRNNFNSNVKYPYFSTLFMISDYVERMSHAQSLDVTLLINSFRNEDPNDDVSVLQLKREHQIELCKLMSRSAGKINHQKFIGLGTDYRGKWFVRDKNTRNDPKIQELIRRPIRTADDLLDYTGDCLPYLTMAESYIAFSTIKMRLTSPYRAIDVYWWGKYIFFSYKYLILFLG